MSFKLTCVQTRCVLSVLQCWNGILAWLQASAADMITALFRVITQRVVVISYRRFSITYRSHFQGSRIQKGFFLCFVDRVSLYNLFQMKPTRCILLLSIFISTSLHVSGNYVPIISRTCCIYATLLFSTLCGWLSGMLQRYFNLTSLSNWNNIKILKADRMITSGGL